MNVTVYQYVFTDRDKTRVHTTLVNDAGAVLDRNIAMYDAYPLKQIADEHAQYMLRVLKRSMSLDRVIYDCNVRGRFEYTPKASGFTGEMTYHPRFGDVEKVRLQWTDPLPEDPDDMDDDKDAEETEE
ncbi:hypothetical protein [Fontibacillus sp. BL9]|uniref:hypothetical protein n=1 Tax=Fontibacillus sp. BL9 TaxID=3389971 RepID=UPI0039788445